MGVVIALVDGHGSLKNVRRGCLHGTSVRDHQTKPEQAETYFLYYRVNVYLFVYVCMCISVYVCIYFFLSFFLSLCVYIYRHTLSYHHVCIDMFLDDGFVSAGLVLVGPLMVRTLDRKLDLNHHSSDQGLEASVSCRQILYVTPNGLRLAFGWWGRSPN